MNRKNTQPAIVESPALIVVPNVDSFTPCEPPALDMRIIRETRDGIYSVLHGWLKANAPADVIDALHQFDFLSHVASEADSHNGLVSRDVNSELAIEVWQTMKLSERLARGVK